MKAKLIAACALKYLKLRRKFTRRGGEISAYVTKINGKRKVRINEICYIIRAFLSKRGENDRKLRNADLFCKKGRSDAADERGRAKRAHGRAGLVRSHRARKSDHPRKR